MIITIIIIYLILRFISKTIEEYICPGIITISDAANLSKNLSAVTLIALANGSGDVITAFVAGSANNGVNYNVG